MQKKKEELWIPLDVDWMEDSKIGRHTHALKGQTALNESFCGEH